MIKAQTRDKNCVMTAWTNPGHSLCMSPFFEKAHASKCFSTNIDLVLFAAASVCIFVLFCCVSEAGPSRNVKPSIEAPRSSVPDYTNDEKLKGTQFIEVGKKDSLFTYSWQDVLTECFQMILEWAEKLVGYVERGSIPDTSLIAGKELYQRKMNASAQWGMKKRQLSFYKSHLQSLVLVGHLSHVLFNQYGQLRCPLEYPVAVTDPHMAFGSVAFLRQ